MPDLLPKRPLGQSGITVSPLGLGTVKFGRNKGVRYPQPFQIPDDKNAADLLMLAHDHGINLIDTAPAYGNSEERLGELLKGQRAQWIICSKVGEEFDPESGKSRFDFSAEHTRASIHRSLDRLKTDYLDIVLIHSDGNDEHILSDGAALQALQDCKRDGLIRAIGMSTKSASGGLQAAELTDVVMLTYSADRKDERNVLDYCEHHNKGTLIKKALNSGQLDSGLLNGRNNDPVDQALSFAFGHTGVSSVIVGTINPTHLLHNIRCTAHALAAPD